MCEASGDVENAASIQDGAEPLGGVLFVRELSRRPVRHCGPVVDVPGFASRYLQNEYVGVVAVHCEALIVGGSDEEERFDAPVDLLGQPGHQLGGGGVPLVDVSQQQCCSTAQK
jgi:hypothetical protein